MAVVMITIWVLAYLFCKFKLRMLLFFLRKDAHSKFMTNYQTIRRKNFQQPANSTVQQVFNLWSTTYKTLIKANTKFIGKQHCILHIAVVHFHWSRNVAPSSMAHHIPNGNACAANIGWNLDRTSGSSAKCKWALQACCKLWVGLLFARDIY